MIPRSGLDPCRLAASHFHCNKREVRETLAALWEKEGVYPLPLSGIWPKGHLRPHPYPLPPAGEGVVNRI